MYYILMHMYTTIRQYTPQLNESVWFACDIVPARHWDLMSDSAALLHREINSLKFNCRNKNYGIKKDAHKQGTDYILQHVLP